VPRAQTPYQLCLAELRAVGLLMAASDKQRSVATIVAGEPIGGSWWGHPAGKAIYAVTGRLFGHKDVLAVKLVDGKVTLVHRSLWPDLLAMATCGGPWQVEWLPRREADLLELVEKEGRVVVDPALAERFDAAPKAFGKSLEARLLVLSANVHTESGAHARLLTSWWTWAEEKAVAPEPNEVDARARLEIAAKSLGPRARLPWFDKSVRRRF
jgi:hypothetical protein